MLGVPLLTVNEKPMADGIARRERHAVPFEELIDATPVELKGRAPTIFEAVGTQRPPADQLVTHQPLTDALRKLEQHANASATSAADYAFELSQDLLDELHVKLNDFKEGALVRGGKLFYQPRPQAVNINIFSAIAISLCAGAWRAPGIAAVLDKIATSHDQQRKMSRRARQAATAAIKASLAQDVTDSHADMRATVLAGGMAETSTPAIPPAPLPQPGARASWVSEPASINAPAASAAPRPRCEVPPLPLPLGRTSERASRARVAVAAAATLHAVTDNEAEHLAA